MIKSVIPHQALFTGSWTAAPLPYKQLDVLHSLRGFCAFYVVIFHAKFILWSGGRQYIEAHPRATWSLIDYIAFAVDLLSSSGYEMVIFFFVLSGFFIRYAQHKNYRETINFYSNRIIRIYPPFLVSLALAAIILIIIATQVPQILNNNAGRELNSALIAAWTELQTLDIIGVFRAITFLLLGQHYIGDNVVYWSLLPEALFYLIVPLAFWRIRWYYGTSFFLFIGGLYCDWQGIPLVNIMRYLLLYNIYFAAGIGLYDATICTNWLEQVRRLPTWLTLMTLTMLLLLLIGATLLKMKVLPTVLAGVLAILAISVMLAGHMSPQNWIIRVMHKIGEFSFSLYLYHYPLLLLAYAGLISYTGRLFTYSRIYWIAVPIVTIICYGLYWITERISVKYFRT